MNLRFATLTGTLILATCSAHAQIGVYATPIFTRATNAKPDSGDFSFLGAGATSRVFSGFGFGAYDDLFHSGRIDAGIDMRASIQNGNGAHLNQFLVGARVAFRPASVPIKPYVELYGGVGGTRAALNPLYANKPEFGVATGLDYHLRRHVDFRVIEVGVSSLQAISSGLVQGTTALPPSARLLNVSTGIVFRFPQPTIP